MPVRVRREELYDLFYFFFLGRGEVLRKEGGEGNSACALNYCRNAIKGKHALFSHCFVSKRLHEKMI